MIVYVPIGSGPLRDKILALGHGMIANAPPGAFGVPRMKCHWVFDNGAYHYWIHKQEFNADVYAKRIKQLLALPEEKRPEWCVCPDKVASKESLSFSVGWRKRLPSDLRWYLAIQDGMTKDDVNMVVNRYHFEGLFIGGSTTWKNERAWCWVEQAHDWGMKAHIGRVNGPRRLQWAVDLGADSIDGTGWTRHPDWVRWLSDIPKKSEFLWSA